MSTTATVTLIVISSASLVVSSATLAIVLVGGKRAHSEVAKVETKVNRALKKVKAAIAEMEL